MKLFSKQRKVSPHEARPGKLPHDLGQIATVTMASDADFARAMKKLSGGIVLEEARYLSALAERVVHGCIVEVGSFRGKSSVALSHGAKKCEHDVLVYCIEPHKPFTGVYGGEFGPVDRREFFRAMLATGAYQNTALVNLSSEDIASNWAEPVAICFIDGDHTYDGVKRDWECWAEHIAPGGMVVFDDAKNPEIGPARLIAEILEKSDWEQVAAPNKFVALRKPGLGDAQAAVREIEKNILVVCEKLAVAGGLLRFERLAAALAPKGHKVVFAELTGGGNKDLFKHADVLTVKEARERNWDLVMVPGAGFSDAAIARFAEFCAPNFGLRVQHILNDQTRRDQFQKVNASFDPDLVIFNNRAWPDGSYTKFRGKQFHFLEGAVDTEFFEFEKSNHGASSKTGIVVGGQATKNAEPLIRAVESLGSDVSLKLFGQASEHVISSGRALQNDNRLEYLGVLDEAGLKAFYQSVDIIVSTETYAGWSNMGAEAAASGVPLVCTPAGTQAFAAEGETAVVLESSEPEGISAAIKMIVDDPDGAATRASAAREVIEGFDWAHYASAFMKLTERQPESHYFRAPDLGLYGKWGIEDRFLGLDAVFDICKGKSVLDLGAAEGLVSLRCMKHGAADVTGFEIDEDRVAQAITLLGNAGFAKNAQFYPGNLAKWKDFVSSAGDALRYSYDVVLYLGIHQHLGEPANRIAALQGAMARATDYFVVRTPQSFWDSDDIMTHVLDAGWTPLHDMVKGEDKAYLGGVVVFSR